MNDDIITYPSLFNPDINITIIFKENKNYELLEKVFDEYGFGFYSPKHKTIMIDGEIFTDDDELNIDDLRFVEAHEISHLYISTEKPTNL